MADITGITDEQLKFIRDTVYGGNMGSPFLIRLKELLDVYDGKQAKLTSNSKLDAAIKATIEKEPHEAVRNEAIVALQKAVRSL